MNTEDYSIDEFKKKVEEIELDCEKVEFISGSILKWKYAIQKVESEVECLATSEFILNLKSKNPNNSLTKLVDNDYKVKRSITREVIKLCAENICKKYNCLIRLAEIYLNHYKTILDTKVLWKINETEHNALMKKDLDERIIWRSSKEKLLELFDCLYKNEIIPEYSEKEILVHFADEKRNAFLISRKEIKKLCWLDSDSAFAVFVDELAKNGVIDDGNKFKVITGHFVNKNGSEFRNLPQKKNYTENFTQTGNFIRSIIKQIGLNG